MAPTSSKKKHLKATSSNLLNLFNRLCLACLIFSSATHAESKSDDSMSADDDYVFDPSLFKGGRFDQATLTRLSQPGAIAPGNYKLDIYVNQRFIGNHLVSYQIRNKEVQPCFSPALIRNIAFKDVKTILNNNDEKCLFLDKIAPQAINKTELPTLKLSLTIPQSLLNIRPRGYVDPESFQTGANLSFVNYLANYYHVSYSGHNISSMDSAWLSLNGGINLAGWQYRQINTATWNEHSGTIWNSIRSYVQRPIPTIESVFMGGQLITTGRFFSDMSYNGVNIATSEAMQPDSMRGYAPVIRGIATSNAKVTVHQNGQDIYQTTVPPGAFEISDLYPTSYSGDLQIQITEADGTIKTFSVPFSAVPESIRPGTSRYSLALGQTRNTRKEANFTDITYQQGLTNTITANGGLRLSQNYFAGVMGGVYVNILGAIGLDTTFSRATLPDGYTTEGWMSHISWSKTFERTGTTVSLANYRYSTSGYRELTEILGANNSYLSGTDWLNYTNAQRSRFDLTLSQNMGSYGNTFVNGSTQNYRDGRSPDTQLQLGYSQSFRNGMSMNISVTRQRVGYYNTGGTRETATSVSFAIPLFSSSPRSVSLTTSYNHSDNGDSQYQTTASGMMDNAQTTSYNLNVLRDQESRQTTVGGNLQKRLPVASVGLNVSKGKDYWQISGNAQGALAVHSGGLTLGPYLGDTFALVEAKGAEGAQLFSSTQTRIDSNGYALVPSVTPYRYNNISINPLGMKGNSEVLDSQKRIVPVAGSSVKVVFRTRIGTALLIKAIAPAGNSIPLGAQVYDANNEEIGITGQDGQIYVRVAKSSGKLTVRWGEGEQYCTLPYQFVPADANNKEALINLTARCIFPHTGVNQ
ncbi:fimbrial biogenesis outer membrane usher protein [Escherichia albertii]|nr:fimbrial biogenesis outer membrane usher protein [Escherichia albertii]